MGFLKKLAAKGPGGSASVAKAMLKKYEAYRSAAYNKGMNPNDYDVRIEALRYALQTRYQIFKTMDDDDIEEALSFADDSLFYLVYYILSIENPFSVQKPMVDATMEELYSFFSKNAPEHLEIFERRMERIENEI